MNTMQKTGFPNGIFTEEEKKFEYFKSSSEHKRKFIEKVVEITRLVTKNNFELNISQLMKGEEPEKTNIFLQNFYKAATSDSDKERIIKRYIAEKKGIFSQSVNQNINIIINNMSSVDDKKIKGYLFWIAPPLHA